MWREAYQFLSRVHDGKDWSFMNYGYAPLRINAKKPNASVTLEQTDENNRYCIQLYHHLAEKVPINGKTVLEIGSGRGGGAYYLKRYMHPARMVGVDFSKNAVAFCNRHYRMDGLFFNTGDAEALPYPDNSFDVVVNVESSHCYNAVAPFLARVKRILKPGGYLLFADFRGKDEIQALRQALRNAGMAVVLEKDITANVLEALFQDSARKTHEINHQIAHAIGLGNPSAGKPVKTGLHRILVKFILEFSGVQGSTIYREFQKRDSVYISCILQKS